DRVWGRPLGDKVQLQIIRHQGTRDQTLDLMTVRVDSNRSQAITIHLDGGRRTETAYVPPPAALQPTEKPAPPLESQNKVLAKWRPRAAPEVTDYARRGLRGDVGAPGRPVASRPISSPPDRSPSDRTFYQTKVAPFVANSVDVTAQATISADRRFVRLSLN